MIRFNLGFLLCAVALLSIVLAKELPQGSEEKDQLDLIAEDESLNEIDEKDASNEVAGGYVPDPCLKVRCGAGRICEVNDKGEGQCVCIPECPQETDDRRRVCSNHNETWSSDCEVYRMRCFCSEDSEECKTKKYKHVHVDYYGECRDIPKCSEEEMEDFPRRMREWLFNIMKDLAQRAELDDRYLELEQEAERDLAKKWANAVIWKFCDLDSHPFDRSVSRHELFPIRAPLLAMEHCIAPFLDKCDADDDHRISLKEWGLCLGLEENEIEDKCAAIRDNE
ncbi:SPARC-like [Argiope bruennichi]|uniref:SPARC-like n=1 Tax=Argiope bruennichi TaxID=94029 RepID=UPI002494F051|nr:SPARC-like [Argiope bruennichi]